MKRFIFMSDIIDSSGKNHVMTSKLMLYSNGK